MTRVDRSGKASEVIDFHSMRRVDPHMRMARYRCVALLYFYHEYPAKARVAQGCTISSVLWRVMYHETFRGISFRIV